MKSVIELVVVGALLLVLFALQLSRVMDPEILLMWSVGLLSVGLGIGVPAGFVYHVLLARALKTAGLDPKGWWLRPTGFHDALVPAARKWVMLWFRLGAAGFVIAMVGCVVLLLFAVTVSIPM